MTLRHGIRLASWKTKAVSAFSWRACLGGSPSTRIVPAVIGPSPATIRSSVLLPQPDGPTSETNWPSRTSNEMSSRATVPFAYVLPT